MSGGEFKKKKIDGQNSELLLFGDMRASLEARPLEGDAIEVGIFDTTETPKAFGHNTDFQGHPTLAGRGNRRQFIPDEGEEFKRGILSRVNESISDIRASQRELTPQELLVQALNEITEPAVPPIALGSTGVAGGTTLGALLGGLFGESEG